MIDEQIRMNVLNWMQAQRLYQKRSDVKALVHSFQLGYFSNGEKGWFFSEENVSEETQAFANIVSNAWYELEEEETDQRTSMTYYGICALLYCFDLYLRGDKSKRVIPNSIWKLVEEELLFLSSGDEPHID